MKKLSTLAIALAALTAASAFSTAQAMQAPGRSPSPQPSSPQTPAPNGHDTSASVRPNGHGCANSRYAAECFTNFSSIMEAKAACKNHYWDPNSYAYIEAEKYLCREDRVVEVMD